MIEIRPEPGDGELAAKQHEKSIWGYENILYLLWSDDYREYMHTHVEAHQIVLLKSVDFILYKLPEVIFFIMTIFTIMKDSVGFNLIETLSRRYE